MILVKATKNSEAGAPPTEAAAFCMSTAMRWSAWIT